MDNLVWLLAHDLNFVFNYPTFDKDVFRFFQWNMTIGRLVNFKNVCDSLIFNKSIANMPEQEYFVKSK